MAVTTDPPLSELAESARTFYENRLKGMLEAEHPGQAVAAHPDTGDYAVAPTHRQAASSLLGRHPRDGRIVTLTIGPPTAADLRLAARVDAARK